VNMKFCVNACQVGSENCRDKREGLLCKVAQNMRYSFSFLLMAMRMGVVVLAVYRIPRKLNG
jgi:hypothetical protein